MPKQSAKKPAKKSAQKKAPKTVSKPVIAAPVAKVSRVPLPSAFVLMRKTAELLWQHKGLFFTISIIYGLLNLVLVRGLSGGTNITELKTQLSNAVTGNVGELAAGFSVFVVLIGSSGNTSSQTAGAYQLFLGLITSLALIWSLRHILGGQMVRARDAFYRGVYPLVPFILVLLVVCLQLLPFIIGSAIYGTVMGNGIAVHLIEKIVWGLLFLLLALLSVYWLTSSLFALYIVTLPDMIPSKALKTARELVAGRRLLIIRKVLFLPVVLLIAAALIMVPIIIIITALAQWIFFLLTMTSLAIIHTYMYVLYRGLLDE